MNLVARLWFALFFGAITFCLSHQAAYAVEKECPIPGRKMNWMLRYCAFQAETDDEIVIQDSKCFKDLEKRGDKVDKKLSNCDLNRKYKKMVCEQLIKNKVVKTSLASCLSDASITPFYAGQ